MAAFLPLPLRCPGRVAAAGRSGSAQEVLGTCTQDPAGAEEPLSLLEIQEDSYRPAALQQKHLTSPRDKQGRSQRALQLHCFWKARNHLLPCGMEAQHILLAGTG